MNTLIKKPTNPNIYNAICYENQYVGTDSSGNLTLILSQDIGNRDYLSYMELAEHFVELVAKSKDVPFVFDKTLEQTVLKKTSPIGSMFYDLLKLQNTMPVNPDKTNLYLTLTVNFPMANFYRRNKYELSENLKVLHYTVEDLQLNSVNFTGNPMQTLTSDFRLLEGELINSFVTRLREAATHKNFKKKLTERKKESTQNITKTKSYLSRLQENSPRLYGVSLVICYESQYANAITINESDHHLTTFLEPFKTTSGNDVPVGWWWKREHLTEVGYRYYLILFFDGQKGCFNPTELQHAYGQHWRSVTGNQGTYFIPNAYIQQTPFIPGDNLASFSLTMQCLLMRDIFLRLKLNPQFDHFGLGELPKLVKIAPNYPTNPCSYNGVSSSYYTPPVNY